MRENNPEKKAYEVVFEYFQNKILCGEMRIADKLPAERDIAEQLGVSRNSVREAIRMLEMMGFIESLQGSGNYICCNPRGALTQSFNMMMVLRGTNYNEIFDTRLAIESEAIELAASRITQEQLERLHSILVQMDQSSNTKLNVKLDIEFHRVLIQASHNTILIYLSQLMSDLLDIFIENLRTSILEDPQCAIELRDSHWDIYHSLVDQMPALGRSAVKQHFHVVHKHLAHNKFNEKHPDFSNLLSENNWNNKDS